MKSIINKLKRSQPHRIDVHHHILPSFYVAALEGIGITTSFGLPFPKWSPEEAIEVMDKNSIATAITSISTPGVYFKESSFSRDLARRCNEYSAQLMREYPDRFGAFASLPLPDVEGALNELEYAIDELNLDGVVLMSNVEGHYLGDPAYEELFAELNRRKLVVFIHPNNPPSSCVSAFVEYPHDTARAIATLMYTGALKRYSKIRFVLAHAGGTVPFASFRIIAVGMSIDVNILKLLSQFLKRSKVLKKMYYDTAASTDIYTLRALVEHAKPSHILFGSNYVWTPSSVIPSFIEGLQEYDGFDEQALATIERDSALELFPRFK